MQPQSLNLFPQTLRVEGGHSACPAVQPAVRMDGKQSGNGVVGVDHGGNGIPVHRPSQRLTDLGRMAGPPPGVEAQIEEVQGRVVPGLIISAVSHGVGGHQIHVHQGHLPGVEGVDQLVALADGVERDGLNRQGLIPLPPAAPGGEGQRAPLPRQHIGSGARRTVPPAQGDGDIQQKGQGTVGPIPVPVLIVIGITALIWYIMNHTKYGRGLYAIGGSRSAAEASGINAKRSIYVSYLINGILVGFAGMIFMARNNAGLPNGAIGYEMTGLTAAIVGGTSFTGGIGTVSGTVAGAFIIGFLENVMNLTGVNSYIQQVIEGSIIVLAVAYDVVSKSKKSQKVIIVKEAKETAK